MLSVSHFVWLRVTLFCVVVGRIMTALFACGVLCAAVCCGCALPGGGEACWPVLGGGVWRRGSRALSLGV